MPSGCFFCALSETAVTADAAACLQFRKLVSQFAPAVLNACEVRPRKVTTTPPGSRARTIAVRVCEQDRSILQVPIEKGLPMSLFRSKSTTPKAKKFRPRFEAL